MDKIFDKTKSLSSVKIEKITKKQFKLTGPGCSQNNLVVVKKAAKSKYYFEVIVTTLGGCYAQIGFLNEKVKSCEKLGSTENSW
jgi:hypothetical protein